MMMHSLLIWGISAGSILIVMIVLLGIRAFMNRCKHDEGFDYAGHGYMICKKCGREFYV